MTEKINAKVAELSDIDSEQIAKSYYEFVQKKDFLIEHGRVLFEYFLLGNTFMHNPGDMDKAIGYMVRAGIIYIKPL